MCFCSWNFLSILSLLLLLFTIHPSSHHTHTHTHQNCSMSYVPDKLMWYTISATHWTHQMKKSLNKRTTKWNVRVLSLMRFSIPFDSTSGCGCVMCSRCGLEALSLEAITVIDIMSMTVWVSVMYKCTLYTHYRFRVCKLCIEPIWFVCVDQSFLVGPNIIVD